MQVMRAAVLLAALGSALLVASMPLHSLAAQLAKTIAAPFQAVSAAVRRPSQQASGCCLTWHSITATFAETELL